MFCSLRYVVTKACPASQFGLQQLERELESTRHSSRKRIQTYTHAYNRTRSLTPLHVPAHRIQTHTQTHAGKGNVWYMAGQCRYTREKMRPLRCPLAVSLKSYTSLLVLAPSWVMGWSCVTSKNIVLWSDVCVVVQDGGHLEVAVCQRERDGQ